MQFGDDKGLTSIGQVWRYVRTCQEKTGTRVLVQVTLCGSICVVCACVCVHVSVCPSICMLSVCVVCVCVCVCVHVC